MSNPAAETCGACIPVRDAILKGDLRLPEGAKAVVAFAHGSGSGRFSPRNRFVAEVLRRSGLATLLMDLLPEEEEAIGRTISDLRFDIRLLAERVRGCADWLKKDSRTRDLPAGYFGASTGAAAALVAAAQRPRDVFAVVSRGGRPDLAVDFLAHVKAPTLLIVGGEDKEVLELNREAARRMQAECRLEIVPGATHLFEERGALEEAARLAADWFSRQLAALRAQYAVHKGGPRATRADGCRPPGAVR